MRKLLAVAALVVATSTATQSRELDWTSYENDFGCVLAYPGALFESASPVKNQPQRFDGPEDDIYFRVQGVDNSERWTPQAIREKYFSNDMPGKVSYERIKRNFVVLSGIRGSSIFYTKVVVSRDRRTACIWEISYPVEDKEAFDFIVTRMSRSFDIAD
jgi:hypothetical protein